MDSFPGGYHTSATSQLLEVDPHLVQPYPFRHDLMEFVVMDLHNEFFWRGCVKTMVKKIDP